MPSRTSFFRSAAIAATLAAAAPLAVLSPSPAQAAPPAITTFVCPIDNGGGRFYCFVDYSSDSSTTVSWTGGGTTINDTGHSDFYGHCSIGSTFTVTVTVTNASGSTSRTSRSTVCRGGPVIL